MQRLSQSLPKSLTATRAAGAAKLESVCLSEKLVVKRTPGEPDDLAKVRSQPSSCQAPAVLHQLTDERERWAQACAGAMLMPCRLKTRCKGCSA